MSHKEKKKRKKKYRGFWLFVKLQIVLILLVSAGWRITILAGMPVRSVPCMKRQSGL